MKSFLHKQIIQNIQKECKLTPNLSSELSKYCLDCQLEIKTTTLYSAYLRTL